MSSEPKIKKVTLTNEQAEKVTGGDYGPTPYTNEEERICINCNQPFYVNCNSACTICPTCIAKQQQDINNGSYTPVSNITPGSDDKLGAR